MPPHGIGAGRLYRRRIVIDRERLAGIGALGTGNIWGPLAAVGGGYGLSVLLSRPATARWMVGYLRLKGRVGDAARGVDRALAQHMEKLARLVQTDPDLEWIARSLSGKDGILEVRDDKRRKQWDVGVEGADDGPNREFRAPFHALPLSTTGGTNAMVR